ncbi:MAG: hypothetical protein Kow0058_05260 [Roseovarius sp.]
MEKIRHAMQDEAGHRARRERRRGSGRAQTEVARGLHGGCTEVAMIICHCNAITERDIRAAVDWMRAADPQVLITPGKVYRALGKKADCGGCLPLFLETMLGCDTFRIPMHARAGRRRGPQEERHEGRREGHRLSQPGAAQ